MSTTVTTMVLPLDDLRQRSCSFRVAKSGNAATIEPRVLEGIERDLLVWHERVSLATAAPPAP